MPMTADRCAETHATAGTGAITLLGAIYAYQAFATAFGAGGGVLVEYAMYSQTSSDWEVGRGTFNGTTGLTRDVVLASSNSNALLTCSGTYTIFATISAATLNQAMLGIDIAVGQNWAMP